MQSATEPPCHLQKGTVATSRPVGRPDGVFDFIEDIYNPRRRHSGLDCLSPIEYEKRAKETPVPTSR
jgi:transposase InsO family protein